jgi:hypothetical protein
MHTGIPGIDLRAGPSHHRVIGLTAVEGRLTSNPSLRAARVCVKERGDAVSARVRHPGRVGVAARLNPR